MRIPVPWVFVLAYLVGVVLQAFLPIPMNAKIRHVTQTAGFALLGAGAVLATWCLMIFRRARTTTIPLTMSSTLVTWGPYRFSRNPMYVSLTLVYLGEAGVLGQVWPLIFLPFVLAYINGTVVPFEEARLQEKFDDSYQRYCATVRRWF
jgi:protein-S-isoprenylcysteine O-methyltransferase Ste14